MHIRAFASERPIGDPVRGGEERRMQRNESEKGPEKGEKKGE